MVRCSIFEFLRIYQFYCFLYLNAAITPRLGMFHQKLQSDNLNCILTKLFLKYNVVTDINYSMPLIYFILFPLSLSSFNSGRLMK